MLRKSIEGASSKLASCRRLARRGGWEAMVMGSSERRLHGNLDVLRHPSATTMRGSCPPWCSFRYKIADAETMGQQ